MNSKPDEKDWMAYLYGELEGSDKERFEQYLLENPEGVEELEKYKSLRNILARVEDKEVIAPPIVLDGKNRHIWDVPYFRTILSIAASLLLIMLVGKMTDARLNITGNEFRLSFGSPKPEVGLIETSEIQAALTPQQVQQMINASLENNNLAIEATWKENEQKLTSSIRKNLALNSGKVDQLVKEASNASQDQIREYVSGMQTENMQLVKDYFQLTSTEQKNYIENLLVDFADYLQQQRTNDLQVVQTRLNSMEQNTDIFKQETEQILSSIITTVGNPASKEVKN